MIMVSACLAGMNCRYDGTSSPDAYVMELVKSENIKLFCPECLGGMIEKRPPSELVDAASEVLSGEGKVLSKQGDDMTERFLRGAKKSLEMAKMYNPDKIIFKAKSPSCGVGYVYDGSFSGKLVEGNGVCAQLMMDNGFEVECR